MPWLNHVSILVEGGGARVVLDAGEGSYRQLRRCTGLDVDSIDLIVITHSHGDHMMGVASYALMAGSRGLTIPVLALKGTVDDILKLIEATHIQQYLRGLRLMPVEASSEPTLAYRVRGLSIWVSQVDHTVPSMGVRVVEEDSGKCIAYSGDTRPSESMVKLAKGCSLLIHEASGNPGFEDEAHKHGHSTVLDAVNIAREANVSSLALIHFYLTNPEVRDIGGIRVTIPYECSSIEL